MREHKLLSGTQKESDGECILHHWNLIDSPMHYLAFRYDPFFWSLLEAVVAKYGMPCMNMGTRDFMLRFHDAPVLLPADSDDRRELFTKFMKLCAKPDPIFTDLLEFVPHLV